MKYIVVYLAEGQRSKPWCYKTQFWPCEPSTSETPWAHFFKCGTNIQLICIRDQRVSEQPPTGEWVTVLTVTVRTAAATGQLCSLRAPKENQCLLWSHFTFLHLCVLCSYFHSLTLSFIPRLCVYERLSSLLLHLWTCLCHMLSFLKPGQRANCANISLARCSVRFLFTHTVCAWVVYSNTYCSRWFCDFTRIHWSECVLDVLPTNL